MPRARQAGDIDVVVADGHVGHDLQLRARRVEHRFIDRVGQQTDERVFPLHPREQLLARNRGPALDRSTSHAASMRAMTEDGSFR